ncbi:hypothetical protein [Winogradskyella sp.]|uniref:hypothetical protein n=1 Tax=Winogradskyella sp. TaxID=1883156 RepID=UPI00261B471B|nr:hypothetical protein [Winogradskyella sp.]
MEEFLKDNYFLITHSLEFLAAVTGLILYRQYKTTAAKFLIYFLLYAFFVDFIGRYPSHLRSLELFQLIENTKIEKNYWWYLIFWMGGLSSFITLINYKIIDKSIYRRTLKYFYFVYCLQFILYAVLNFDALFDPNEKFLKITSIWMIIVAVTIYLLEILQSDKVVEFYKSIYFYINVAVLIWTIITGPMIFYEIYFSTADWNFIILKWQIYLVINVLFYVTLTLALVFCKPKSKS